MKSELRYLLILCLIEVYNLLQYMNQERTFQDITRVVSIYRGLSIKFEAYGKYKLLQYIVYSYEVLVIHCLVTFKENLKEFFMFNYFFYVILNIFSISFRAFFSYNMLFKS